MTDISDPLPAAAGTTVAAAGSLPNETEDAEMVVVRQRTESFAAHQGKRDRATVARETAAIERADQLAKDISRQELAAGLPLKPARQGAARTLPSIETFNVNINRDTHIRQSAAKQHLKLPRRVDSEGSELFTSYGAQTPVENAEALGDQTHISNIDLANLNGRWIGYRCQKN